MCGGGKELINDWIQFWAGFTQKTRRIHCGPEADIGEVSGVVFWMWRS